MKKFIALILTIASIALPQIAFANDEISVYIEGEKISFDQPPVIVDGHTLVSMRALFEALGAEVIWDGEEQSATGFSKGIEVTIFINQNYMSRNLIQCPIDVPAQIINERTMIPLRVVSEAFGMNVDWNAKTRTILMTNSERIGYYDWNQGFYYYGELLDRLPNGFGILYFKTTDKPSMCGIFDYPKYPMLVKGVNFYPSGSYYVGTWNIEGECDVGTHYYPDGTMYDGVWDGLHLSEGSVYYSDGTSYVGTFYTRLEENYGEYKEGTYTYADSSKFVGSFKSNRPYNGILYTIYNTNLVIVNGSYVD